jgi:hypothetical protein
MNRLGGKLEEMNGSIERYNRIFFAVLEGDGERRKTRNVGWLVKRTKGGWKGSGGG